RLQLRAARRLRPGQRRAGAGAQPGLLPAAPGMSRFALDPRLAADSRPLASLELCELRIMDDARWPWLLLVPRVPGATELLDLDPSRQSQLLQELDRSARALRACVPCDKLNIAALGNVVAQLHVHLIARRRDDAA